MAQKQCNPPIYTESPEFNDFVMENSITVSNRYGYVCNFLYRPYYFPGQTVRGYAIIDLFNDIAASPIIIRIKGKEVPGKHGVAISRTLIKEPSAFKVKGFNFPEKMLSNEHITPTPVTPNNMMGSSQ